MQNDQHDTPENNDDSDFEEFLKRLALNNDDPEVDKNQINPTIDEFTFEDSAPKNEPIAPHENSSEGNIAENGKTNPESINNKSPDDPIFDERLDQLNVSYTDEDHGSLRSDLFSSESKNQDPDISIGDIGKTSHLPEEHSSTFQPISTPSENTFHTEELPSSNDQWDQAEDRLSDLQENFIVDFGEKEKTSRRSPLASINDDDFHKRPIFKFFVILFTLIILGLLAAIVFFTLNPVKSPPSTTPPISSPINSPYPLSIYIFGVNTPLKIGQIINGTWNPVEIEWLGNSDVCRLIAIPGNKSTEPSYLDSLHGSLVQLSLSNGDQLNYIITDTNSVDWDTYMEYSSMNVPSIAIAIYDTDHKNVTVLFGKMSQ